ncbi:UDP-glycosyltransferase 73C2-like [Amaranthus tricolor]|uniref:UDP-glycosyltransferase 73C2-like n=1 Tax=Amaranthus tricolor TaxID=29722 RepID=UPI002588CD9A|nr:UDP-glycosyltransferase 73C2-like [Amaranthus tricolor]
MRYALNILQISNPLTKIKLELLISQFLVLPSSLLLKKANMENNPEKLHFVLFPLMAPGHMIPIIDIAKLLAKEDITVTIVTTPVNASRFESTIDRAIKGGLDIRVSILSFPWKEFGLPEGCENVDLLPSLSYNINFIEAAAKLQEPMENLLQELEPTPSCLISDLGFTWTTEVARKFNIPRVVFNGTSCFSLLSLHNLITYDMLGSVKSDTDSFMVSGLPDRIELTRTQVPNAVHHAGHPLRVEMRKAESEAFGMLVNSFEELESEYYKRYKEAKGKNTIWCVGPVSLCNQDQLDKEQRGSLCNFDSSQIMELALGLEASKQPFILAVRGGHNQHEVERLIEEDGLKNRVEGRGLIIMGWAPQVLILSHPSIGGFLTHCGWNSTIEGISAGVPLITCPLFSEQFLNSKFVVQVLKVGININIENPRMIPGEEARIITLKKECVKQAVQIVMDDGKEGKELRERAERLAERAKKAVDEGGSSSRGLRLMIQDVIQQTQKGC